MTSQGCFFTTPLRRSRSLRQVSTTSFRRLNIKIMQAHVKLNSLNNTSTSSLLPVLGAHTDNFYTPATIVTHKAHAWVPHG